MGDGRAGTDVGSDSPADAAQPPAWELAQVFEVDYASRVQCECHGCGQTIYKQIHMILFADGRVECWGSTCFKREMGAAAAKAASAEFPSGGHKLTPAEREMLASNRAELVAWFLDERRIRREREAQRTCVADHPGMSTPGGSQAPGTPVPELEPRRHRAASGRGLLPARPTAALPSIPQPLDDPRYVRILEELAADWKRRGTDVDSPLNRRDLILSARARFERMIGRSGR